MPKAVWYEGNPTQACSMVVVAKILPMFLPILAAKAVKVTVGI